MVRHEAYKIFADDLRTAVCRLELLRRAPRNFPRKWPYSNSQFCRDQFDGLFAPMRMKYVNRMIMKYGAHDRTLTCEKYPIRWEMQIVTHK